MADTKKVLITGVGGYIASHAASVFLENGFEVVGVDNLSTGYKGPTEYLEKTFGNEKFRFYKKDLADSEQIKSLFAEEKNIDAVIHFAASCNVNESMENPYKYFSNNVMVTLNLLEEMKNEGIGNLVFSSTCALYGTPKTLPVDETHPANPESPYGESKYLAEQVIKWYGKLFPIKYAILRYFNVCGAKEDGELGDSKKPSSLLVQNAVRGALGIAPFQVTCGKVDTPDGSPIRDYINVMDLSDAHEAALNYLSEDGESDIFNIGTGVGYSVLEIINAVKKITGVEFPVSVGELRKGESAKIYADTTKVEKLLKWKAKRSIEESVESLVLWYKKHPHGWEY